METFPLPQPATTTFGWNAAMRTRFFKTLYAMLAAAVLLQAPAITSTALGDYYLEREEWYDPSDWFNGTDYEWEYDDDDDDGYYGASYYDDGYADDDWFYDSYDTGYDYYDTDDYGDYTNDYYYNDYDYADAYDYDLF